MCKVLYSPLPWDKNNDSSVNARKIHEDSLCFFWFEFSSKTPQNSASTVVLLERVSDESFIDQNNQNIPFFKVKDGLQNFKQGCRFGPESKSNPDIGNI